jgi:hypothetical protein
MGTQASMGKQIKVMLQSVRGLLGGYPFITLGVGVFLGLVIGLVVLGWWLWPVKWTDARPADLSSKVDIQYQQDFIRLAADALAFGRPIQDIAKWFGDGWTRDDILKAIDKVTVSSEEAPRIQALKSALSDQNVSVGSAQGTGGGGTSPVLALIGLAVIAIIAIALLILILRRIRSRQVAPTETLTDRGTGVSAPPVAPAMPAPAPNLARGAPKPVAPTAWAGESQPPLAQYVTQYALGDDRYDMSFSIEKGNGDFLGECGVGISETIGVGNPDKVTALEVWLFDKNDIRTLTKVFMSEHCFNDPALRAKLAPKGEAVMIKKGEIVTLATQTLKVNARVIDLQYGSGNLPPNSFFQQAKIELAAWSVG